jgi:hypothetical protein
VFRPHKGKIKSNNNASWKGIRKVANDTELFDTFWNSVVNMVVDEETGVKNTFKTLARSNMRQRGLYLEAILLVFRRLGHKDSFPCT